MLQVIPAIDVLDGRVVRLLHGDYDQVTVYSADPVTQALDWQSQGAGLVHVVDLEGARSGVPDRRLWEKMGSAGVTFQVGGGIRDAGSVRAAFECGASRVVLGTAAVWNPEIFGSIGPLDRVVAAVDVRQGRAVGAGWLDEGLPVKRALDNLHGWGLERILVTGIDRDGAMKGPDLGLMREAVGDGRFRVIASGGIGVLEDLADVADVGCEAVIVGRALYERRFLLREAMAAGGAAPPS